MSETEGKSLAEALAPKSSPIEPIPEVKLPEEPAKMKLVLEIPPVGPTSPQNNKKLELLGRANTILTEYDMLESNIPINSEYWSIMNQLRSLR
jgi:hypothetical protein